MNGELVLKIDVYGLLYELYKYEGMREFPLGIYIPYELEPIARYRDVIDCNGKQIKYGEYLNEMWIRGGGVINDTYRDFKWEPYIPYRPMKVIIEYVKHYLDNKIRDREILKNCPILNDGPIGYTSGYIGIVEVARYLYNVILPDALDSRIHALDEVLDGIDGADVNLYNASCIGEFLTVRMVGNIYEIRYKSLLEEVELNGKENICKRDNDTLDRGV